MDTSSFESDLDGWTTGGMDRSFWRNVGSTPYSSTGPSSAADGSYYVYALAYNNYNLDFDLDKAFSAGQELYGIAFQYHMYGYYYKSIINCPISEIKQNASLNKRN